MARDQEVLQLGKDAKWWQKLFGLSEPKARGWAPAIRPGHSATGEVVTGRAPDWSRYDNCMRVSVSGESHYQDALIRVSKCPDDGGEHGYECSARLVLEPDNQYDKFAVKIMVDGEHVGYLPRGTAKRFGPRLRSLAASGKPAICMAYIGRQDGAPLGVNLRLPYDGEVLQGMR